MFPNVPNEEYVCANATQREYMKLLFRPKKSKHSILFPYFLPQTEPGKPGFHRLWGNECAALRSQNLELTVECSEKIL